MTFKSILRVFEFQDLRAGLSDMSATSILKYVSILIAAVIEIHILEGTAWQLFEPASRPIAVPALISVTTCLTIFFALINLQQVFTIRMLPNSSEGCLLYTIYIEISTMTSVIVLVTRSPFIALFSIERCLMNIYLAFFIAISAIVMHNEKRTMRSIGILFTSHLSLILVLLILPYIVNLSMLNTTFIMVNMIIFTFILNVTLFILMTCSNHKVATGITFSISEHPMMSLDTLNNSQHDEIAQEVLINEERETTHEERSEERKEKLFYEVVGIRENSFNDRETEKRRKAVKIALRETDAILDDMSSQLKVINECSSFLLSNCPRKDNNVKTIMQ